LQLAVEHLHDCGARWRKTIAVHEKFQERTIWKGDVEIFDLHGHEKAKRCYVWAHLNGPNDELCQFVAVLEVPPVIDSLSAVRVQNVKDAKGKA